MYNQEVQYAWKSKSSNSRSCNQVAFEVIGADTTISIASEHGQLQLNVFEPINCL